MRMKWFGMFLFALFFLLSGSYVMAIHQTEMNAEKIEWHKLMKEGDDLISQDNIVAASVAAESYKEALRIAEKVFGSESEETAESLRALALLYYKEDEYEKGYIYYDRYVELGSYNRVSNGGRDLIYAIVGMGKRVYKEGNYSDAEIILQHSLEIAETHFANQRFDTGTDRRKISNLTDELNAAVREIAASLKAVYAAKKDGEKIEETQQRAGALMQKIRSQKGRN